MTTEQRMERIEKMLVQVLVRQTKLSADLAYLFARSDVRYSHDAEALALSAMECAACRSHSEVLHLMDALGMRETLAEVQKTNDLADADWREDFGLPPMG